MLAQLAVEAGLPPGVLNIVTRTADAHHADSWLTRCTAQWIVSISFVTRLR